MNDLVYKRNVEDEVIDESEEHILNIDNTHLRGYSTPGKYIKECRECELAEDCEDKVSTDETADWYIKGKYKCYYAHQIGVSQLAGSAAPVDCVVLNGKLRSIGIRAGEVIENGRRLRAKSASKGRIAGKVKILVDLVVEFF